jgi:hypothetical protein
MNIGGIAHGDINDIFDALVEIFLSKQSRL